MNPLISLSPADVAARLKAGQAVLIDVREPDEHAREHIAGAGRIDAPETETCPHHGQTDTHLFPDPHVFLRLIRAARYIPENDTFRDRCSIPAWRGQGNAQIRSLRNCNLGAIAAPGSRPAILPRNPVANIFRWDNLPHGETRLEEP